MLRKLLIFIPVSAAAMLAPMHLEAGSVRYDYAEVVNVRPIQEERAVPVDREVCWEEHGREPVRGQGSAAPTIVGAIIGGVIGNQFGGGSGKRAMTAAGAVLGGSVGYESSRRHRGDYYPVTRERCTLQRDYEYETWTSGYLVDYEYRGEIYQTRTSHPPGERIRIEVAVRPVR